MLCVLQWPIQRTARNKVENNKVPVDQPTVSQNDYILFCKQQYLCIE